MSLQNGTLQKVLKYKSFRVQGVPFEKVQSLTFSNEVPCRRVTLLTKHSIIEYLRLSLTFWALSISVMLSDTQGWNRPAGLQNGEDIFDVNVQQ